MFAFDLPVNTECARSDYYLGLPMWNHRQWLGSLYPSGTSDQVFLQHYAAVFSSVEGNTTFYATPSLAVVERWRQQFSPQFKACFKLPKRITHDQGLRSTGSELHSFFQRLELLLPNLGPFMIQLPAAFDVESLPYLDKFLQTLPQAFTYAVEVRNAGYFQADDNEKRLNQLLQQHGVNRVCFDSRALFSRQPADAAEQEAQTKKPHLPVHALATACQPIVRFIGTTNLSYNQQYLLPWKSKIEAWVRAGLQPFIFIHTPDNVAAPLQAQWLHRQLSALPNWRPLSQTVPTPPAQQSIF